MRKEILLFTLLLMICYAYCATTPVTSAQPRLSYGPETNETLATYKEVAKIARKGFINFALRFQEVVSKSAPDTNVLFAPVNLIAALATLLLGSRGNTEKEISNAIGVTTGVNVTAKEDVLHTVIGKLLQKLISAQKTNPYVHVNIAKGLFVQNGTTVREEYQYLSKLIYENDIEFVDFTAPNNQAVNTINGWVSNRTNGKINDIVKPDVSPTTKLIIAHALYFDGEWEFPFQDNSTWQPFNTGKNLIKVKMMKNKASVFTYYNAQRRFVALGIPYKGRNMTMYLVLPDERENITSLLSKITAEDLQVIPKNCTLEKDVDYSVPYLDLDANIDAKSVLQTLGINDAFDQAKANLSKISDNIYVSDAVHKVNLQVTEAGSTGTAATTFVIDTRFPESNVFLFNRPFFLYIYYNPLGLITFWATVKEPSPNTP